MQASYWSQVHRTLVADLCTPQPREGALDPVENLNLTPQPCSSPKLSPILSSFFRDRGIGRCVAMAFPRNAIRVSAKRMVPIAAPLASSVLPSG